MFAKTSIKRHKTSKRQLVTQILCVILAIIMVLGCVIPAVSATGLEETMTETSMGFSESNEAEETVQDTNVTLAPEETPATETEPPAIEELETVSENTSNNPPSLKLPEGFEYVKENDFWTVKKTVENKNPAFMLTNIPEEFDVNSITLFFGNLETHEVGYLELHSDFGYVSSTTELKDGYYIIFAKDLAWEDSRGNLYAINGGEYQYFYVGNNYDPNTYGISFELADDIIEVKLKDAVDGMQTVDYGSRFVVTKNDIAGSYPEDAKLTKLEDVPESESPQVNVQENTNEVTVFKILGKIVKDSAVILVFIAVCYVGLIIVRTKKRSETEKQMENDMYDEKHIE